MKIRMKIMARHILSVLLFIAVFGMLKGNAAYGVEKIAGPELLIVIDNSGSMQANMDFLKKVIDIIDLIADESKTDLNISYLVFNENTQITDVFESVQIISGKQTCIMQGIESADQWMEERIEKGISVKVLFISDLFSSRYIENGQVQRYDVEYALTEQKRIKEIEDKWKEWCNDKKANILIWTWESLCATEKKENTIDHLKNSNTDKILWGYQVKFAPVKNTIINVDKEDGGIEFLKRTVQSFEILLGSPNVKWTNFPVNSGERRKIRVGKKEKQIYLFFPDAADIQVTYKGVKVASQYGGLYLLDKKEEVYYIKAGKNIGKRDGYKLSVPNLEWNINFPDGGSKRNIEFTVVLSPSSSFGGNQTDLAGYSCTLKVLNRDGKIVDSWDMKYNDEKGYFYVTCKMKAGIYTFIGEVNGKEVDKQGRSVN